MFHVWYPIFKNISFKSTSIELPVDFVDYLKEDGIWMDENNFPVQPQKKDRYDEGEEAWEDATEEALNEMGNYRLTSSRRKSNEKIGQNYERQLLQLFQIWEEKYFQN
jgi:hypothetical protein